MSDDLDKKQEELKKIQDELKGSGLSRRNFLNRLSAVGVGFGAALALGVREADARNMVDAGVNVSSTNPAVDDILAESKEAQAAASADPDDPMLHMAQYGRSYRRGYRRAYSRYARYARVYRRFYSRYARVYRRFYARF